jgi:hypothetical protein
VMNLSSSPAGRDRRALRRDDAGLTGRIPSRRSSSSRPTRRPDRGRRTGRGALHRAARGRAGDVRRDDPRHRAAARPGYHPLRSPCRSSSMTAGHGLVAGSR